MRIAVVADETGGGRLRELAERDRPRGHAWRVADLAAEVRRLRERADDPRWVWASTDRIYPALVAAGVRVARCHDTTLVEALLLAHEGRFGAPRSLGAAWARLRGRPVPPDPVQQPSTGAPDQTALFDIDHSGLPAGADPLEALIEVHADQIERIAATERPQRFALLAAVESAGALAAVEMAQDGVPWRGDVHDRLLTGLLGPRPARGARPPRMQELAEQVSAAFGHYVNPDSPAQLVKAFAGIGKPVPSTRSGVLRRVEHPVVPLLLRYKELARLHSAHGWHWLDTWVRGGRFRPEYVVGGVVSGRWATRGGGALQIPKVLRGSVVADPGWTLVVADAGQLEPRILAAVSGDAELAAAAGSRDLYAGLADVFGGDRQRAKIGLLAAMYGQTGGDAAPLLRTMGSRFPRALEFVDAAARAGEQGRLVSSWLGRTCPPPASAQEAAAEEPADAPDETGKQDSRERANRAWGRFTRNFVIQATAAEWALVLMAALRRRITELNGQTGRARLVFFQHDELVLHVPKEQAEAVVGALADAEAQTRRALFADTPVRFPLDAAVVGCYADADHSRSALDQNTR